MRTAVLAILLVACGGPEDEGPSACAAPNRVVDGRCVEPGVADDGCAAGTLAAPDGGCMPAGIPATLCAEGFAHDGAMRCEPILPAGSCPEGSMAVPGEAGCRPVMPCGAGKWGDIPIDATTEHVDATYLGVDSDGSALKPWSTIGDAVTAAAPGALVAIAQGIYSEDVIVYQQPLRIWGVCPEQVEIAGSSVQGAVQMLSGASGSELHGVAVRGALRGIGLSDVTDVVVDRVWVHHTGARGIEANPSLGPVSLRIQDSLVEQAHDVGIYLSGVQAEIEGTVVRATQPAPDLSVGWGINIQVPCGPAGCDTATRADVSLRRSIIEHNHDTGITVSGSDALIEATVVRDTWPRAADQEYGRGINVQAACTPTACEPNSGSAVTIKSSIVERSHELGVSIMGSSAIVEGTLVRDTFPQPSDQKAGRAINAQPACVLLECDLSQRSQLDLRASVLERSVDGGVIVMASDAIITSTVIQDVVPDISGDFGTGVSSTLDCQSMECPANASSHVDLIGSVVERVHLAGLYVLRSHANVKATLLRTVAPDADGFGDGVTVVTDSLPTTATIVSSFVSDVPRAGMSTFGADISLASTKIQCAGFDLEGEPLFGRPFSFADGGGNGCGCPVASGQCEAVSANLAPPSLLE